MLYILKERGRSEGYRKRGKPSCEEDLVNTVKAPVGLLAAAVICAGAAIADVQVNERSDEIVLADGEKVEGIIVMKTRRAVVIIEKNSARQRIIAGEDIVSIKHGAVRAGISGYRTEDVGPHKEIVGEGFRMEERKSEQMPADMVPEKPPFRPQPHPAADKTAVQKARDLISSYRNRYPVIGEAIEAFLGSERLAEMLSSQVEGERGEKERYREIAERLTAEPEAVARPPVGRTRKVPPKGKAERDVSEPAPAGQGPAPERAAPIAPGGKAAPFLEVPAIPK